MKNILEKIQSNYESRLYGIQWMLNDHRDWEILKRILNLDPQDCFNLFRCENKSLEDVETLCSMLSNCLLDDSDLNIQITGKGIFTFLYVGWGNDCNPRVKEEDLAKMLDLIEEKRRFYANVKKQLDQSNIEYRELLKQYYSFDSKIEEIMLSLASESVQKEYYEQRANQLDRRPNLN